MTCPSDYLGRHVLDQLLSKGYRVCGTVRSQREIDQIRKKYPRTEDKLEFCFESSIGQGNCNNVNNGNNLTYWKSLECSPPFIVNDSTKMIIIGQCGRGSILVYLHENICQGRGYPPTMVQFWVYQLLLLADLDGRKEHCESPCCRVGESTGEWTAFDNFNWQVFMEEGVQLDRKIWL